MKKIKLFLLLYCIMSWTIIVAQSQYSLYVGDRQLLSAPKPPGNSAIFQTAWGSSGAHLKLEKFGTTGCYVTVTGYFEGIEQVQCDYYWYWYDNYGYQHTNHATTYYTFRCYAVTLSLSTTEMELNVDEGENLEYTYSPSNVYPKPTIQFVSRNTNVAKVYESGYVCAVGPGTTYIDVLNSSGPDAHCKVVVRQVDPTRISLDSYKQAYVGESVTLTPTIYPSYATTLFTWYSKDTNVAKVSSTGVVTGVNEGVTYVYAVSSNGLKTNECQITVSYRKATSISVSPSTLYLPISHQSTLKATVSPLNAKYTLTWSSSNPKVAEVDQNGRVTALKAGDATISVKTDNGYVGQCKVTVPPNPSEISIPTRISLMYKSSRKLKSVVLPANAYTVVTWRSDNNKVATVSSDGTVNANFPGTANISVITQNGKIAVCRVEVEKPVFNFKVWTKDGDNMVFSMDEHPCILYKNNSLKLEMRNSSVELDTNIVRKFTIENSSRVRMPEKIGMVSDIELRYGTEMQLMYKLYPTNYDILTNLTWSSSNSEVVSVSQDGKIIANSPGEAEITLTASNGTVAKSLVFVPVPVYPMFLYMRDGRYDTYYLSEHPKVVYDNSKLIISTEIGEVSYEAEKVRKISFVEEDVPLVTEVYERSSKIQPSLMSANGDVKINGLKSGSRVFVYTIKGLLYATYVASIDGCVEFNLNALPAGIYLVKSENLTYKIIKQ